MSKIEVRKSHTLTGHRDAVYTLCPAGADGAFFSAGGDGMVVAWDLSQSEHGEAIAQLPNSIYALHYFPGHDVLLAGHNYDGVHVLDWRQRKELASLKLTSSAIFDIQSRGNEAFVATGDGTVIVIDVATMNISKRIEYGKQSARTMAVNTQRSELAVGYSDHKIRIFDLEDYSLKKEWVAHANSVFTLKYTPDLKTLLSGSRDAHLKAWDPEAGYALKQDVAAHLFAINHLAFSPDGKHFVTCSMDKSIKVWNTLDLNLLKVIDKARHAGHGTSINKLLWNSFTGQVISASDDRSIAVWDLFFNLQPGTVA